MNLAFGNRCQVPRDVSNARATVGGSGVGADLLRRVIASFPAAKERVPDLRMIVVAGPRIDAASLPSHAGLEIVPYVHNLYRHLAACDLAVVQGGLTTAMELTAQRRPFLYSTTARSRPTGPPVPRDASRSCSSVVAIPPGHYVGARLGTTPNETDTLFRA